MSSFYAQDLQLHHHQSFQHHHHPNPDDDDNNNNSVNLCQLTDDKAEKNAQVSVESCVGQSLNEVKAKSDPSMPHCQVFLAEKMCY